MALWQEEFKNEKHRALFLQKLPPPLHRPGVHAQLPGNVGVAHTQMGQFGDSGGDFLIFEEVAAQTGELKLDFRQGSNWLQ